MQPFWPVTPMGWVTLGTALTSLGAAVFTGAKFVTRLDHLARRQEIAEFKAEYKQLEREEALKQEEPELESLPDPLLEDFNRLELVVRTRERLARQAACKHENGVTCMVQFGTMDKVHYCNDCGALTKTHT